MKDEDKTREQLIKEVAELRGRLARLEGLEEPPGVRDLEKAAILASMSELVTFQDLEMRILWANKAASDSVGLTPEELLGRHCYEVWHDRREPCHGCPVLKARESGKPEEGEITTPDGRIWLIHGSPVRNAKGDIQGIIEVTLEITEHKRTELMLRQSEEKYRRLVDSTPDWIWSIDLEGRVTFTNPAITQLLGYQVQEITGASSFSAMHPEEQKRMERLYQQSVKQKRGWKNAIIRWLHKDGSIRYFESTAWPVIDAAGNLLGFSGIDRDITERQQVETELKQASDYLENVFQNSADGIGIVDRHGKFLKWNKMAAELYGYSFEELRGKSAFELYADKHKLERMLAKLRREGLVKEHEINMKKKDGTVAPFALSISLLKDASNKTIGSVCVARDLTQQKSLQAQLLHAQKMEAIGTLAGGVAHDFRNLLQTFLGYADLLLFGKGQEDPGYRELQEIKRAARRGAELVQRLLTFSRKVETKIQPLDLNQQVEQARRLLERTIPKMIDIELRLAADLKAVNADPVQMEQVLMNLAINAKDAMPEGGKLVIETENVTLDQKYCQSHLGARPGDYVLLTVSDTGCGMNKQMLDHIFEPFYTTKEVGGGTGLGLAVVYGIVKSHQGYIACYSELGQGTTFKIYLPVVEPKRELHGDREGKVSIKGGSETVLLVDDDEAILALGEQMLARFGYRVLTAADGEKALEIYRKEKQAVDLVILDMIMPGMGGKRCLAELLAIDPKAKVIIASGYSAAACADEERKAGARGFVSKPFDIKQMLQEVRMVLDEESS